MTTTITPTPPETVASRRPFFLERLDQAANRIEQVAERRRVVLLAALTIVYTVITGAIAARKLLWNDELFTYYLARLPRRDLWAALATGAEQIPPSFHQTTRAFVTLLGDNNLALRLPEMIGFWVMCLCLFQFVARRAGALCGFVALLFPLVTYAYEYAYEARPYGIVLGFSGLALLCWQSAAADNRAKGRTITLPVLALSLAGAVSMHYYAVFALLPLALGEAARTLARRRLDLAVWAALLAGSVAPLAVFFPLIRQARSYGATFWSPPAWIQVPNFYGALLMTACLPLVGALVVAALYAAAPAPAVDRHRGDPVHTGAATMAEIIAALSFAALPVVMVLAAKLVTHAFTYRYALPAVIGVSALVAFAAGRLLPSRAVFRAGLALLLLGGFVVIGYRAFKTAKAGPPAQSQTHDFLAAQTGDNTLPIVIADPHTHALLSHYAPRPLATRITYLADPAASLRILGHNSVDQGMVDLVGPVFGFPVDRYAAFLASHGRFWVYGTTTNFLNWQFYQLASENRPIHFVGRNGDYLLFLVEAAPRGRRQQSRAKEYTETH